MAAFAESDGEKLIKYCGQVEDALDHVEGISKYFIDADADAMLGAGICIGALQEYRRTHFLYCGTSVVEGAKKISQYKGRYKNVQYLLEASCR